jgi:putative ABC transport system substrate-binding protein
MHYMKRRNFITLLGGAATTWPFATWAQQAGRARRIGVLMSVANGPEGEARLEAFLKGLQQLGWIEGRNVRIDQRWGAGDAERARKYAAELVALGPDVILVGGATNMDALQRATHHPDCVRGPHRPRRRGVRRKPRTTGRQHYRLHIVRVRIKREMG